MKKTLITLLALAGVAMADTYTPILDVTDVTSANATATFDTTKSATIAITLNVEKFAQDLGGTTGNSANHKLATLTGTWEKGGAGSVALGTWGNGSYNGIQLPWTKAGSGGGNVHVDGNENEGVFTPLFSKNGGIAWDNVEAFSLVLSFDKAEKWDVAGNKDALPVNVAYTLLYTDGTTSSFSASNTGSFKFGEENAFDMTGVTVNGDYVDSYQLYNVALGKADAEALSKAMVVPEPATATLSLLALAGLAARRRRK